jgi:hypothetical protein
MTLFKLLFDCMTDIVQGIRHCEQNFPEVYFVQGIKWKIYQKFTLYRALRTVKIFPEVFVLNARTMLEYVHAFNIFLWMGSTAKI